MISSPVKPLTFIIRQDIHHDWRPFQLTTSQAEVLHTTSEQFAKELKCCSTSGLGWGVAGLIADLVREQLHIVSSVLRHTFDENTVLFEFDDAAALEAFPSAFQELLAQTSLGRLYQIKSVLVQGKSESGWGIYTHDHVEFRVFPSEEDAIQFGATLAGLLQVELQVLSKIAA